MPAPDAHTVTLRRVVRAPAEWRYRAFLDPDALAKWLPPRGFTARVLGLQARVGGDYRMQFTRFATGEVHTFGGRYLALEPHTRIVHTNVFDDPAFAGEMHTAVTLRPVSVGTALTIEQAGIPAAIPTESCHQGWQDSLAQLAWLTEGRLAV
jgi:uncharacterized protein YndB with AHSA1/START domain